MDWIKRMKEREEPKQLQGFEPVMLNGSSMVIFIWFTFII